MHREESTNCAGKNNKLTSCMLGIRVALLGQLLDLEHVWLQIIVPRDLRIPDFVDQVLVLLKILEKRFRSGNHRLRIFLTAFATFLAQTGWNGSVTHILSPLRRSVLLDAFVWLVLGSRHWLMRSGEAKCLTNLSIRISFAFSA